MGHQPAERRRETRYPIEAKAIVRTKSGQTMPATALDISSRGMRLQLEQPCPLQVDEEVTVEVELPDRPDKPFSSWGAGRIAHIDGCHTGIELYAGNFDSPLRKRDCASGDDGKARRFSRDPR